ncbi:MAG: bacterioferritin [Bermanella sp.]
MKGSQKIIDVLNELLAGELTAMDQYFIHSRMYEDWGLSKLFERISHEMEDETGHADAMIRRILFLEGKPNLAKRDALDIGSSVSDMLRSDLNIEYSVVKNLKAAIALCEIEKDFETRAMLVKQLADTEEDHAYWLEKQLGLIDKIGIQNYLQAQM